jgi:hypothetical protein
MARKILMLDFDGVLHPSQGNTVPEFAFAPRLASALATGVCSVVISSTWREHHTLQRLCTFLPQVVAARVVGVLGADCAGPHTRYRTILAWLQKHASDADWRALDDSASEFPRDCPQLIRCDGLAGFGPEQAAEIRNWFSDRGGADF